MAIIIYGRPKPIYGIPVERKFMIDCIPVDSTLRFKFRSKDWARVFLKTKEGIRHFILVERTPEYWGFDYEQGRNATP